MLRKDQEDALIATNKVAYCISFTWKYFSVEASVQSIVDWDLSQGPVARSAVGSNPVEKYNCNSQLQKKGKSKLTITLGLEMLRDTCDINIDTHLC